MNADAPMLELLTHTAVKGALVLMVALLLGLALKKLAAARRYAIWISAVAALAVLPPAMSLLPAWRVLPQANMAMDGPVFEPEMPGESQEPLLLSVGTKTSIPAAAFQTQTPAPVKPQPVFSWQEAVNTLPVVWIALSVLFLLRLGWSAWRLYRLERTLKPGTSPALDETAREIGLSRVPKLLVGAANSVPMVWGVWRPRLLLPAGFESWSADKLRGVLLHELAHLKRGDPLALWITQWVKALHWFNPLAWLTIHQLRADQERACDDAVLRHGVRASDYAQHLLDLSRHTRIAPGLALCALTITRCAPVEARVKAILDPKRHREGLTPRWLLGLAGFALLTTLPMAMLHAIEGAKLRGRILDRNGVVLAETTKEKLRNYSFKTLAAHVIGYTGKSGSDDPTPQGRSGVEKQQDERLRSGKDVTLTLDMRIQSLVHRAMSKAGVERGAAVVLDPRSGEILAMVSLPSYDLNAFIPTLSKEDWDSYLADRDLPLFDRCAVGQFAPGSAFMPLTALAGISAGVGNRSFECQGQLEIGARTFHCWIQRQNNGHHGKLGMPEAIVNTCSCFWYQFGIATGAEAIEKVGGMVGMGQHYGIFENESDGILPGPKWLSENRPSERWSDGAAANTAIGQGSTLVTPLQLAVLAATIGNAGKIPQPKVLAETKTAWRADLVAEGLSESQIAALREGMRLVVQDKTGTGRAAQSDKVVIAGKTGTAQSWRRVGDQRVEDNHAWFIGFAPYDKPTLAFAILKQGAKSGGHDCAPIAKRLIEEALALPADGSCEVKPVEATGETTQAKFDFDAAEASRQIKLLAAELKIYMKEFKMGNGQVTILGEAAGMIQALLFRDRLIEIGRQQQIEWTLPVLRTREDGVAEFRANGNANSAYRVVIPGQEPRIVMAPEDSKPASQGQIRQQSDAAIRMRSVDADNWKFLKGKALLADLPAEGVVPVLSEREKQHSSGYFQFRFSAPRAAVRRWLLESLRVKSGHEEAFLNWPEKPGTFYRTYSAVNDCQIVAQSADGETVLVVISMPKPRIMIAPDEATPPRPKTAAPKELEGVVDVERGAPLLPMPLMRFETGSSEDHALRLPEPDFVPTKQKNPFKRDAPIRLPIPLVREAELPSKFTPFGGKKLAQSLLVTLPESR